MTETFPKRVLVTGGGTGIGLAIVKGCLEKGSTVIALGRRKTALQAAAELGAETHVGDVTKTPGLILDAIGPIDGLVHNAGTYSHRPVGSWTKEDWQRMWRVHVEGPALLSQSFAQRMSGPGAIVAVSSTLASRPAAGATPYASSKAALVALIQGLALELAPRGIRANVVLPGVVSTAMTEGGRGSVSAEAQAQAFTDLHPLGRVGVPGEVAHAVCACLGNPWMTGTVMAIDGGLMIGPTESNQQT